MERKSEFIILSWLVYSITHLKNARWSMQRRQRSLEGGSYSGAAFIELFAIGE